MAGLLLGMVVALKAAALEVAPDGDLSGSINDPNPSEWVAVQCGWPMDRAEALATALARCGFLSSLPSIGTFVVGSGLRAAVDTAFPRVRLKTPEERAAAEAEAARRTEEIRRRGQEEREHREAMKAAKRAAARVYFIQQDGPERLVKIGMTTREVSVRLRELQAGHSCPLVVLTSAPGGRTQESDLHFRFAALRVSGEWFRPGADLMAYIALVADRGTL